MSGNTFLPVLLLCLLAAPLGLGAYTPVVVVGAGAEGLLYSSEGLAAEADSGLHLVGLASWRSPWGEDGYAAAGASAGLDYLFGSGGLYDEERLLLEARLPAPLARVFFAAGLDGSLAGTISGALPYLRPDWKLAFRLWDAAAGGELELAGRGDYLLQPDSDEDSFYHGLQLRLGLGSSIRARYGLLLEGGWELWPELELYDAAGALTGEARSDLVGSLEASVQGLAGYFFDWGLAAELGGRLSNANRWVAVPGLLEESTENRVYGGLRASTHWSPHRRIGLEVDAFVRQELYLLRDALTEAGTLSGEPLRVFSAGTELRADWTLGDRLFFVLAASAGWRLANETAEERWNLRTQAGIELRL